MTREICPHVRHGVAALALLAFVITPSIAQAQEPNILVIWGDDVGITNISAYSHGLMGYQTPNIDRIAREGALFTDYYAEQSCTAGRSSFITGQIPFRTGLSKVGMRGRDNAILRQYADNATMRYVVPTLFPNAAFPRSELGPSRY